MQIMTYYLVSEFILLHDVCPWVATVIFYLLTPREYEK